jgi:hypothetical protein
MSIQIVNSNPEEFLAYQDNFLSDIEIENLLLKAEKDSNFKPADVRQPDGSYKMIPEYRNNERGVLVIPELTIQWFHRAEELLPIIRFHSPAYFDPVIKFYKYKKGEYFDWHKDAAIKDPDGNKSKVTFMIYLTDIGVTEYEFANKEKVTVQSKKGRMVMFNHKILHRSPPLEDGIKISCRLDVIYMMNLPE